MGIREKRKDRRGGTPVPMGSGGVQRARFWGWLISHILLALIFMAITFSFKYPNAPKTVLYSLIREAAKARMQMDTSTWKTEESRNFVLKYKPQDAPVAGMVLDSAEKFHDPVSRLLGYYPSAKIPLALYPDRDTLGKSFGWSADQGAMGVYWAGVIRVLSPLDWVDSDNYHDMTMTFDSNGPMAHEYAHLVMDYITAGNYPRWLTEGVAQYVEREVQLFFQMQRFDMGSCENNVENHFAQLLVRDARVFHLKLLNQLFIVNFNVNFSPERNLGDFVVFQNVSKLKAENRFLRLF